MSALELIRSTLAAGGEHLGDVIWWTLADARIPRDALIEVWTGSGLPVELLPEPPSTEKAFKSAVKEAQVGQLDRLIRLGKESPDEIVFAVVREQRLGDGSLEYHQEARIRLDRQRDVLETDALTHDVVLAIRTRFDDLRTTHVADDVRRSVVRALASFAAVTLRPGGGVYWTPSPFAGQVRLLQEAVHKIGNSNMSVLPVHRSPESVQTLGDVARASLEEELASLRGEIEAFLAAPPERASTLVRRFDAFEALRSRARLYRDVLSVQVQNLDQNLDQLAVTVEQMLAQRQNAA